MDAIPLNAFTVKANPRLEPDVILGEDGQPRCRST